MIEVIIPTRQPADALLSLVRQIEVTAGCPHRIIHTGSVLGSASVNRNLGLSKAALGRLIERRKTWNGENDMDIETTNDAIAMVDDDVEFPPWTFGWLKVLIQALARPEVVMASAQLYAPDGKYAYMTGLDDCGDVPKPTGETLVRSKKLLTACCAFKPSGLWFDEHFVGSGFEDVDFCNQLVLERPDGLFLVCHDARAVHRNEAKEQRGDNWKFNEAYYAVKWGG